MLPTELLLPIFAYADAKTTCTLSQTCRKWHSIIQTNDAAIYLPKLRRVSEETIPHLAPGETYKDIYKIRYVRGKNGRLVRAIRRGYRPLYSPGCLPTHATPFPGTVETLRFYLQDYVQTADDRHPEGVTFDNLKHIAGVLLWYGVDRPKKKEHVKDVLGGLRYRTKTTWFGRSETTAVARLLGWYDWYIVPKGDKHLGRAQEAWARAQ
ncbi:hypothetical protein HK104_000458 [Borealophlyctis nickersoniae]|nr:hypothetical protein HK104_000458 [Borealophlyctis nickersoniae]